MASVTRPEDDGSREAISNHQLRLHYQATISLVPWDGINSAPSGAILDDPLHLQQREQQPNLSLDGQTEDAQAQAHAHAHQLQGAGFGGAGITQLGHQNWQTFPTESAQLQLVQPLEFTSHASTVADVGKRDANLHDHRPNSDFHPQTSQRDAGNPGYYRDLNSALQSDPGVRQAGVTGPVPPTVAHCSGGADSRDTSVSNVRVTLGHEIAVANEHLLDTGPLQSFPDLHRQNRLLSHQTLVLSSRGEDWDWTPVSTVAPLASQCALALGQNLGPEPAKQWPQLPAPAPNPGDQQAPPAAPRPSASTQAAGAPDLAAGPVSLPSQLNRENTGRAKTAIQRPETLNLPLRPQESQVVPDQTGSMRYNQGDLAILSAEVYDDGGRFPAARRAPQGKKKQQSPDNTTGEDKPRKRAKVASPDSGEKDDEEKKRARGRPRLETTDQTPAEVSFARYLEEQFMILMLNHLSPTLPPRLALNLTRGRSDVAHKFAMLSGHIGSAKRPPSRR
jgi:hypothetical protein